MGSRRPVEQLLDGSPSPTRATPSPRRRTPADSAESGRGLQLVEGLTHRWGVDPQKRGKAIWYELDCRA
ncbi:ATP-binding protein [Kitasatospora sp. NPDC127116]|uniref:ATP-binding protein n=1 Tax=Kitasatospora sp. NPDC127116 TaxID=3345367 RepID=UPI00364265D4